MFAIDDAMLMNLTKKQKYDYALQSIENLTANENNSTANMANITAVLMEVFNFLWVGFYVVINDELVLGPFQGSVACTRIAYGKGVCGACWQLATTQLVPNVEDFEGHIACSSSTKSEIVIPIFANDKVRAVLDIDSENLNNFDRVDVENLELICKILNNRI